jgi:uncharacterized protein
MINKPLPEYIDPFRYAGLNLRLEGVVKLAEMKRLGESITSIEGSVATSLQFGVDEQGIVFLKGNLEVSLVLQCQRCLEPFDYGIMASFVLGIVNTLDEANALPNSYEPVLVQAGELALKELIEDELILNLPIIPKHEPEYCKVTASVLGLGEEQGEGKNPFHILGSLKLGSLKH